MHYRYNYLTDTGIYDLENDADLAFNIDNLVMQGGSSSAVTKASFQVRNINIITSQVTEQ